MAGDEGIQGARQLARARPSLLLLQRKSGVSLPANAVTAEGNDAVAIVDGIARRRGHRLAELHRPVRDAPDRRSRAAGVGIFGILVETATDASGRRLRLYLLLPLMMGIIVSIAVGMLPRPLLLLTLRESRTTGGMIMLQLLLSLRLLLLSSSLEETIVVTEIRVESPFLRLLLLVRLLLLRLLRLRRMPPLHLLHLHDYVGVVVVLHPADVAHAVLAHAVLAHAGGR